MDATISQTDYDKNIEVCVKDCENKGYPICFWPSEESHFDQLPWPVVPSAKVDTKEWTPITQFQRDPFDSTHFGKQIEAIVKADAEYERCGWTRNGDTLTLWHRAETTN